VYAGWGFSQAFYWQQEYKKMGYSSLEDFPGRGSGGDPVAALKTIKAKMIVLPATTSSKSSSPAERELLRTARRQTSRSALKCRRSRVSRCLGKHGAAQGTWRRSSRCEE
jgi:hypothetical protein